PGVLQNMIEEGVPRLPITVATLTMILQWCKYHVNNGHLTKSGSYHDRQRIWEWETQFLCLEEDTLFDVLHRANFLQIRDLFEAACRKAAAMIKD
ncbi:hypothetical protein F5883DRAFT_368430, partial [Diaporthe sp. PMI_573]